MERQTIDTFEKFMTSSRGMAMRFTTRLTGNHDDAEDLLQRAYARAYRAFDRRDPDKSLDAWLKQIIFHLFLDETRAKKRRVSTYSLDFLQSEDQHFEAADEGPNPEESFMALELSEPLKKGIAKLNEKEREIVYLCLIQRESHKDVAELLKCNDGTVKSRLHKALSSLRRHLHVNPSTASQHFLQA